METLLQDVRFALRILVKSPVFTTVAVLTLAIGIGANTAIFSLVDSVLLKMLPIRAPQELVIVGDSARVNNRSLGTPQTDNFSVPLYHEIRDNTTVFSGMYAAATAHRILVGDLGQASDAEANTVARIVTGNYFSVLGTGSAAGRLLTPEDDRVQHGHPVAVISYNYWQRKFSSSTGAIGTTVRLNGYPFTIIGVAQRGFSSDIVGEPIDLFVPLAMQAEVMRGRDWYRDRNASWLQIVARRKPGVSLSQIDANVNLAFQQILKGSFGAALNADELKSLQKRHVNVVEGARGLSEVRREYQTPLLLLMLIVALVLLIACVNVANLLLSRASIRQKELTVRLAIGASPRRVLRQLLTESVLLAFLGGVAGALVAVWGVRVLVKIFDAGVSTTLDGRVLCFTAAICLITGLLFGLAPGLKAVHAGVAPALKEVRVAGSDSSSSRWGWGKILIIGQVALSLCVLFAAGLLVRSLSNLEKVDTGYSHEHVLLARIDPISAGYNLQQTTNLSRDLLDRLAHIPGVSGVTLSENGLFSGTESDSDLVIPGFTSAHDQDRVASTDQIGPNYFSTLGIPVLLGREIGYRDTTQSPSVAVINETMAKFYFPDQNPIGRKFYIDDPAAPKRDIEIIGVVRDSKQQSLRRPAGRRAYLAFWQQKDRPTHINVELQASGNPSSLVGDLRKEVKAIDPVLPIDSVRTMEELIDSSIGEEIAVTKLSSFFAGLALVLACIGLYGIMANNVASRTREIGLRMALGAGRTDVLRLVLRQALLLVGIGIVIGIPASLAGGRLLSTMLFGLGASDPVSLGLVAAVLAFVAACASYIPAHRATRIDPMVALRHE